jgi:hypothetical protein
LHVIGLRAPAAAIRLASRSAVGYDGRRHDVVGRARVGHWAACGGPVEVHDDDLDAASGFDADARERLLQEPYEKKLRRAIAADDE